MKKAKITAIIFLALALVMGGLWFYWERPFPLHTLIPEEQWVRMEMEQMLPGNMAGDMKFVDPPMAEFLEILPSIRVSRTEERPYVEEESFRITLYKGEAWPTVMYISPTGRIHIAANLQFDDWKDYEGGEALYQYLSLCSGNLSAILPAEKPQPHTTRKTYIQPQNGSI